MPHLIDQPDATPTRKVTAAGVGGAGATALVWLAQQLGLEMPAEVAGAIVTLAAVALGYLTREWAPP